MAPRILSAVKELRRHLPTLATAAVLLFALGVSLRQIGKERREGPSALWVHEEGNARRLTAAAAVLPPRGVVGFVGEQSGAEHFDALRNPIMQQVQYELAPRLVVDGVDAEAVLVVFPDAATARAACAARGLTVAHDLGGGMLVARPRR